MCDLEPFSEIRSHLEIGIHISHNDAAQQTLISITTFEFITVFLTICQYLSHLARITIKRALDIIEAHEQIEEVSQMFKDEQEILILTSVKYMIMQ